MTSPLLQLRRLVRAHPPLYRLAYACRRHFLQWRPALSTHGTEICIEGYPSSGNSFARLTCVDVWPGIRIGSHRHCIAAVRIARKLHLPTLILIREPLEAIASCVVRFRHSREQALVEYADFYRWTETCDSLSFLDFDTLFADPMRMLDFVSRATGRTLPPGVAELDLPSRYRERHESEMIESANQPQHWVVPNLQKEMLKNSIKRELSERWPDTLRELSALHRRLSDRTLPPVRPSEMS